MIVAAIRDDTYNFFLLLHIVAVLIAFAPAVINPLLAMHFQKAGDPAAMQSWSAFTHRFTTKISLPSMVVILVTGVLMIVLSDDVIEFSDTWISLAFLVWLAIAGIVSARIAKGERMLADGDMAGQKMVEVGGQIATVLLLVMFYLMIFKPGA